MKIKINEQEYEIKYSIRSLFIFEQITEKPFSLDSTLDHYIFFYSMLLANNRGEKPLDWDQFIDAIDEDPTLVTRFSSYLTDYYKSRRLFGEETDSTGEKKN